MYFMTQDWAQKKGQVMYLAFGKYGILQLIFLERPMPFG